jgi:RNA polymerase sigma-70 factor, ECF subfamily
MLGPRSRRSAVDGPRTKEREAPARADDGDRDIVERIARATADQRDRDRDHDRDRDLAIALELLIDRHGTAVYRFCRQQLHDTVLAEDVHQQVFSEAFRDLTTFSGRSTLRTWLFAIARYRVLDAAKARRRARAYFEEDDMADAPDPTPQPGQRIDDARLLEALVECVSKLDEQTRTIVLLRYQQGFTFEEISEICKEKPGTLQARVTRALPRLRRCIEARTGGKV